MLYWEGLHVADAGYNAPRPEVEQNTDKERNSMPRLTEQQEIVRFIEADRPLPDKYRFLLFEDNLLIGTLE